jgi:hypothetical protein
MTGDAMTTVLAPSSPGGLIPPEPPREDATSPCPPDPSAIMLAGPRTDGAEPRLDGLRPQERVSLTGTIAAADCVSAGFSPVYRCVLTGAHGELDLLFLGRATIAGLIAGTRCSVQGTTAVHDGRLAIWNPRYQVRP